MNKKITFKKLLVASGISVFFLSACSTVSLKSSEDVITEFKSAINNVRTVDMSVDVEMTSENADDNIGFKVKADGKLDRKDKNNHKIDFDIKLDGSMDAGERSISGEANFKIIALGGEYYLNLLKFNSTDEATKKAEKILAPYMKKWQLLPSDLMPDDIKKFQNKDEEELKKEEKVRKLFIDIKLFEVIKEYGAEKLDGRKVYHYGIKLNKEGVREYVNKASTIMGRELTIDEIEEYVSYTDRISNMELYISKEDYLLYKAVIDVMSKGKTDEIVNNTHLVYTARSYNKDIKIEKPTDYVIFNPIGLMMGVQMMNDGLPEDGFDGEGFDIIEDNTDKALGSDEDSASDSSEKSDISESSSE